MSNRLEIITYGLHIILWLLHWRNEKYAHVRYLLHLSQGTLNSPISVSGNNWHGPRYLSSEWK